MFTKQNLLAAFAGSVTLFLLGWIIWGMVFMDFFQEHSNPGITKPDAEMNLGVVYAGNLLLAWIMSSLYGKWASGNYTPISGIKFGSWFGLFVGTGLGLVQMGTSNLMDAEGHVLEAVLELVYHAIVGLVIALVYRKIAAPSS